MREILFYRATSHPFLVFSSAVTGNAAASIPAHGPPAKDRQSMKSPRQGGRPPIRGQYEAEEL